MIDGSMNEWMQPEFTVDHQIDQEEWERHGSCLASVYSAEEFLRLAVTIGRRFDLLAILTKGGVSASYEPQRLARIREVLEAELKVRPRYECDHHYPGILVDVWLCFERDEKNKFEARLIDCELPDVCFEEVYLLSDRIGIPIKAAAEDFFEVAAMGGQAEEEHDEHQHKCAHHGHHHDEEHAPFTSSPTNN